MAHPDHIAALCQGVDHWNAWRRDRPLLRPDLVDLDVTRDLAMLLKSDDPFDVYLNGIDLSNANLDGARLDDTSLANADLSSATLRGAAIRSASLLRANLEGADLCRAELNNTNVTGCRLGEAVFGDTRLLRLDVSHVEGLKGVEHRFDSMVDVETLLRTAKGFEMAGDRSVARFFLGQAGVPDNFLSLAFAEG